MPVSPLHDILQHKQLTSWFQPIVNLKNGDIHGYEGLIRGPVDSPLHLPDKLFMMAQRTGTNQLLETACRETHLNHFSRLNLPGKLFLNVSPSELLNSQPRPDSLKRLLHRYGLAPHQIVIEVTEHQPIEDYDKIRFHVDHYRKIGFAVAIDDLGAGYNGLRLLSELRPEYVKIDHHFIQGIDEDFGKRDLITSLFEIARGLGCRVIAEGIETADEFQALNNLGCCYGQGFYFARPHPNPLRNLPPGLIIGNIATAAKTSCRSTKVASMARRVPFVSPHTSVTETADLFASHSHLNTLPVVENDRPVGAVYRHELMNMFVSRYGRDLHGRRPISRFMNHSPLIVELDMPIEKLSLMITEQSNLNAIHEFIITRNSRFFGIGTVIDLLRKVTELQIRHARYANPLTMLPGNVPLSEHLNDLLMSETSFVACYFDLDNFKPYNDHYGYSRGDSVLNLVARLLTDFTNPQCDFVGHIGGDDFIVIFQSPDWECRSRNILQQFDRRAPSFYDPQDRLATGITSLNRSGDTVFFPIVSLSVGAVRSTGNLFHSNHEISAAASEAKKQAKHLPGSALFIERRQIAVEASSITRDAC